LSEHLVEPNGELGKSRALPTVARLQLGDLCPDCLKRGIVTAADTVHREPPWTNWKSFVLNPVVSLCASCHTVRAQRDYEPGTNAGACTEYDV
jgi:hypothetical protein